MASSTNEEGEHERRERPTSQTDAESEGRSQQFSGTVSYDAGDSAEALLDQFQAIKRE